MFLNVAAGDDSFIVAQAGEGYAFATLHGVRVVRVVVEITVLDSECESTHSGDAIAVAADVEAVDDDFVGAGGTHQVGNGNGAHFGATCAGDVDVTQNNRHIVAHREVELRLVGILGVVVVQRAIAHFEAAVHVGGATHSGNRVLRECAVGDSEHSAGLANGDGT